jgi:outer membrane biosynthesis protein TonB
MSTSLAPWVAAALALHAGLAFIRPHAPEPSRAVAPPMEIDLSVPAPATLPERAPEPQPAPAPAHAPAVARASPAPAPAARAAPLLTAAPSPNADPVAFVTDPSGNAFGYGVVARGGTATQASAAPAGAPEGPTRPIAAAPVSTPPSDWTRGPRLDETDPCRGFFPRHAIADVGRAALVVIIEPDGHVASATVTEESPAGDGFGEAARTCLRTKAFAPALGRQGEPTRARATVHIRFSR